MDWRGLSSAIVPSGFPRGELPHLVRRPFSLNMSDHIISGGFSDGDVDEIPRTWSRSVPRPWGAIPYFINVDDAVNFLRQSFMAAFQPVPAFFRGPVNQHLKRRTDAFNIFRGGDGFLRRE